MYVVLRAKYMLAMHVIIAQQHGFHTRSELLPYYVEIEKKASHMCSSITENKSIGPFSILSCLLQPPISCAATTLQQWTRVTQDWSAYWRDQKWMAHILGAMPDTPECWERFIKSIFIGSFVVGKTNLRTVSSTDCRRNSLTNVLLLSLCTVVAWSLGAWLQSLETRLRPLPCYNRDKMQGAHVLWDFRVHTFKNLT